MKRLVIGILAHVDAGKTTLSEALLYQAGALKRLGRVDHRDAFLDTFALERERGITIFSKQAELMLPGTAVTLLDTPGHVDFSAEMERTLQVLDCAVLVVSGTDGVQAHTETLWRLLARHRIPTFIFINKMDIQSTDRAALLAELKSRLDAGCVDFGAPESMAEELAVCDETVLEHYLESGKISESDIASLTASRKVFPCYFGSALKLDGVSELLDGIDCYAQAPQYDDGFGARVFKIARDGQGNRLTYLKITGGSLAVRSQLSGEEDSGWQEKVNQIRVYSGEKYQAIEKAESGMVCAVTGLTHTRPGMGLGSAVGAMPPVLEPVLNYRVGLPEGCDAHVMLQNLRQLEEEDPQLRVVWNERLGEIHLQLMGEVQLEILTRLIADRFGVEVSFDEGSIVYKETIAAPVIGIGHFEPLRHYAEVHLLLEPGERGSGMQFATACPTDALDLNWQRLVLTHLVEKAHRGVLTGAPVTDMKITLLAGRAHVKHTEGGDFREATYRAMRNGLMQAESILLEPYYAFRLELPDECVGRAMNDIQRMDGTFDPPEQQADGTVLTGTAPVSTMRNYWTEVAAYTKGRGRLSCTANGYAPCHNAAQVIEAIGYDAEHDTENTADSVFCSHGAGHVVKWDEVAAHAHVDSGVRLTPEEQAAEPAPVYRPSASASTGLDDDKELRALFERTYGPIKDRGFEAFQQSRKKAATLEQLYVTRIRADDYLLVDGYNIIFAWDELHEMANADINAAREALINVLSNYQSVRKCHLIVVFDAYKVKGGIGSIEKRHGLHVVYTREAETADMYIEQASYDLSRKHRVRVATSDGMEQMIILGHGAERLSATELKWEVEQANQHIEDVIHRLQNR
ncbi:MAG TPA: TetM/TetW/TetO/TetS family tetracycline resistance ribosomal protection protein [Candidatus Agathobaculum stercoravium]|nr:TetM/TetW/TetO/TetS family tetracycline resistance ribosomal protection protein [Candidatus Agathobaculum stercoravium]